MQQKRQAYLPRLLKQNLGQTNIREMSDLTKVCSKTTFMKKSCHKKVTQKTLFLCQSILKILFDAYDFTMSEIGSKTRKLRC